MSIRSVAAGALLAASLLTFGCSTEPRNDASRQTLSANVQGTVSAFTATDPSLRDLLDRSAGYAIYPAIGQAGFIVGGANGRGEVWSGGKMVGFSEVRQGSVGATVGAQTFSQIIVFLTPEAFETFKRGNFRLGASASAVALTAGAAAATPPGQSVAVFVRTTGGLMASAAVTGQTLTFAPN